MQLYKDLELMLIDDRSTKFKRKKYDDYANIDSRDHVMHCIKDGI